MPLTDKAKIDDIANKLKRSVPTAYDIVIEVVVNKELKERYRTIVNMFSSYHSIQCVIYSQSTLTIHRYNDRRDYLYRKHPNNVEQELWHGTSQGALDTILSWGFQPPSDTVASEECPYYISGITTTLCGNSCEYCTEPHKHSMCHMYGLGVYFADAAEKSERYCKAVAGRYSQLFCLVNLGSPCLLRGNLLQPDSMHDLHSCDNPEDFIDRVVQPYDDETRHESYHVDGLGMSGFKRGYSVINSEYIIFSPSQAIPKYIVTYSK